MESKTVFLVFHNAWTGNRRVTQWRPQDITVDGVYMALTGRPRPIIAYWDHSDGYWTTIDDGQIWTGFTFGK
jgi:hypothetical protein